MVLHMSTTQIFIAKTFTHLRNSGLDIIYTKHSVMYTPGMYYGHIITTPKPNGVLKIKISAVAGSLYYSNYPKDSLCFFIDAANRLKITFYRDERS